MAKHGIFSELVVQCASVFNQPSLENFGVLAVGWVLAGMRAMTSRALRALGDGADKHFSSYYRFFSRAVWNPDALGTCLVRLLLPLAPPGPLDAVVDDTLARKSGKHIWGANVHHDPLHFMKHAVCFGHNWVVLAMVIRVPLVERPVSVPVYWRLYRSKKKRRGANARGKRERKVTGAATDKDYRTRPELAREMLAVLRGVVEMTRIIHLTGDTAYGGKSMSRHLPENTVLISRMTMKAALYEQAPAPKPGRNGRPRRKGRRLPSPEQMAQASTPWHASTVSLYGKRVKVRYKTVVALWYKSAGTAPVRVVVVRDPAGKRKDDCFFSSNPSMKPEEILETYAKRWSLEVAFRDAKQCLGFEHSQCWTRKAVERTGPFAFVSYAAVVWWFAREGHRHYPEAVVPVPWYRDKRTPSFADMHQTARFVLLRDGLLATPNKYGGESKLTEHAENLLRLAA